MQKTSTRMATDDRGHEHDRDGHCVGAGGPLNETASESDACVRLACPLTSSELTSHVARRSERGEPKVKSVGCDLRNRA